MAGCVGIRYYKTMYEVQKDSFKQRRKCSGFRGRESRQFDNSSNVVDCVDFMFLVPNSDFEINNQMGLYH